MTCTCRHETTEDYDVITEMCAEHAHVAELADTKVQNTLDYELDILVREAAGGKRVKRIWPADPT